MVPNQYWNRDPRVWIMFKILLNVKLMLFISSGHSYNLEWPCNQRKSHENRVKSDWNLICTDRTPSTLICRLRWSLAADDRLIVLLTVRRSHRCQWLTPPWPGLVGCHSSRWTLTRRRRTLKAHRVCTNTKAPFNLTTLIQMHRTIYWWVGPIYQNLRWIKGLMWILKPMCWISDPFAH